MDKSPTQALRKSCFREIPRLVYLTAISAIALLSYPTTGWAEFLTDSASIADRAEQIRIEEISFNSATVFSDSLAATFWGYRLLNRLHIKTKKSVLIRENHLKPGDLYDTDLAYETERALRNLPFIYDAEVRLDTAVADSAVLRIWTKDKWSLKGGIQLTQQPGKRRIEVGVDEVNLLGLGHHVGVKYIFADPDPNYYILGYSNPRMFNRFFKLQFAVRDNPFDRTREFSFSRPYLRQEEKISWGIKIRDFRQRELKLSDRDTTLILFQDGTRLSGVGSYRTGDFHNKWLARLTYDFVDESEPSIAVDSRFELIGEEAVRNKITSEVTPISLPIDSSFHQTGIQLGFNNYEFHRTRRISYQGRTEDVIVTRGASLYLAQARATSLGGVLYSTWRAEITAGARLGNLFVRGYAFRQGWVDNSVEFRSLSGITVSAAENSLSWVTLAARVNFLKDERDGELDPLSVDEFTGVRGYNENTRTGDRTLVGNFEMRYFPGVEALVAKFGFVTYFDYGAAWDSRNTLGLDDFVWSAGAGLRVDLGQAGGGRLLRFDLTYADELDDWRISTGVGQFFGVLGR